MSAFHPDLSEVRSQYIQIIDDVLSKSDLTTISQKGIRKSIQDAVDFEITSQKAAINELIMQRFNIFEARVNKKEEPDVKEGSEPAATEAPPTSRPTILVIGSLDTKAAEIAYLYDKIREDGRCNVTVLDVGWKAPEDLFSIRSEHVVRSSLVDIPETSSRGEVIEATIEASIPLAREMVQDNKIHGIVSAGGSCNTSISTAIMRETCPIGFPKLVVTTMASGDIKHYVEELDITIMPSVVDVAGLNSLLEQILSNAVGAIIGMTLSHAQHLKVKDKRPGMKKKKQKKKRIAISMFGVTTPCVNEIRRILEQEKADDNTPAYELYIFHATGSGGKAMERLINTSQIDAVIDLTTTEIADHLFNGVLSAGPSRLSAAPSKSIPLVVSAGATDMINFGPLSSLPSSLQEGKTIIQHNPAVTLMRTTPEECEEIGKFIVEKLVTTKRPDMIKVLLPTKGVSMLSAPGQVFNGSEADEALFGTIEKELAEAGTKGEGQGIAVERMDCNINDVVFARRCVEELKRLMDKQ